MTQENLISAFEQVGTMQGRLNAAAAAGACHNFSIHWCALMYGNSDPAKAGDRMASLNARKGGANPVLQKTYVDAFGEEGRDWKSADNLGVAVRGLVRPEYAIENSNFDQAAVRKVIKTPKFDAMVYSFSFPGGVQGAQGGVHTIAFFRKLQGRRGVLSPVSDNLSAYDPNFGEYYVPALQFNYWLNKIKNSYSGTFTTHRMFYVKENR